MLDCALQVLRQYGAFLLNLLNDHAGQAYLDQADRLERQQNAARTAGSAATDRTQRTTLCKSHHDFNAIFDEHMAVMIISGDHSNMGQVLGVNAGACTMLSRPSVELIGSMVHDYLPVVMAWPLKQLAAMFLAGRTNTSAMIDEYQTFGLRKNGSIFPVKITVRQISGGTQPTVFLAMISEVPTPAAQQYLLFDRANERVFGMSAGLGALLNLTPDAMSVRQPKLKELLPSIQTDGESSGDKAVDSVPANALRPVTLDTEGTDKHMWHRMQIRTPFGQCVVSGSSNDVLSCLLWIVSQRVTPQLKWTFS